MLFRSVGSNHTTLDAIKDIKSRRPFVTDEITQITVWGSQVTIDHVGWPYEPQGLTSAQLNLPFCIATLLLEGDVSPSQFDATCITDEKRINLSRKVRCIHDPEITARGSKLRHMVHVEILFFDGTSEKQTREFQRGSELDFADDDTVIKKFKSLTNEKITAEQQDRIIDSTLSIERLKNVKPFINLITC